MAHKVVNLEASCAYQNFVRHARCPCIYQYIKAYNPRQLPDIQVNNWATVSAYDIARWYWWSHTVASPMCWETSVTNEPKFLLYHKSGSKFFTVIASPSNLSKAVKLVLKVWDWNDQMSKFFFFGRLPFGNKDHKRLTYFSTHFSAITLARNPKTANTTSVARMEVMKLIKDTRMASKWQLLFRSL